MALIIPADRLEEERAILDKIRRGEGVHNLESARRRKDGSVIDISLTISPIRNSHGRIVGASTIARDISELKRTRERQQLLLREMNHRVKNLFALTGSIIGLSARSAKTSQELAEFRPRASGRAGAGAFAHLFPWRAVAAADDAAVADPGDRCAVRRTRGAGHRHLGRRRPGLGRGRRQPRPAPARIRHQRREIRRPVVARGDDRDRLHGGRRQGRRHLDRARRTRPSFRRQAPKVSAASCRASRS